MNEFNSLVKRWGESILSEDDALLIVGGNVQPGATNNCECNSNNCSCKDKINNCNCHDDNLTGNNCLCGKKPTITIGGECPPGVNLP